MKKLRKELEERLVELRSDSNRFRKINWEHHLEDALIEFSEIEEQLKEGEKA